MPSIRPKPWPSDGERPSRPDVEALEPETLFGDRFRIVRKLASGSGGHLYEAVNIWTNRRVALKLLRPEGSDEKIAKRRFRFEAEAATRVAHPNVVEVIASGRDPDTGHLYFVQELLEGVDLAHFLKLQGRLAVEQAMAVMAPVMRALQAAHERGVIHRDLKPENIFISRSPEGDITPKIIDFGVARLLSDPLRLTEKGRVNGTPLYMSPEQIAGELDLDVRADLWSVGVIWYELLVGRVPFDGADLRELLVGITSREPEALDAIAPDVPAELARVIQVALSKDREQRFDSMKGFLDALALALEARREDEDEPELTLVTPPPARPSRVRVPETRASRWRVALPVLLMLTLIVPGIWYAARITRASRTAAAGRPLATTTTHALLVTRDAVPEAPLPPAAAPWPTTTPPAAAPAHRTHTTRSHRVRAHRERRLHRW